jgi:hypothetical protein
MPKAEQIGGIQPLPRYVMPDMSEPEYDLILDELRDDGRSSIGSSFFYIKSDNDGCVLCRVIQGAGKIYFHEVVNHLQHGISDEDLELSVKKDPGTFALPGHYHISDLIEKKLHALMEFS